MFVAKLLRSWNPVLESIRRIAQLEVRDERCGADIVPVALRS